VFRYGDKLCMIYIYIYIILYLTDNVVETNLIDAREYYKLYYINTPWDGYIGGTASGTTAVVAVAAAVGLRVRRTFAGPRV